MLILCLLLSKVNQIRWIWAIAIVLVIFLIYTLLTTFDIYCEERDKLQKTPKEEMFYCHVKGHGMFRKKHCFQLFPDLGDHIQNAYICPMCYKEATFDAPDRKLTHG